LSVLVLLGFLCKISMFYMLNVKSFFKKAT